VTTVLHPGPLPQSGDTTTDAGLLRLLVMSYGRLWVQALPSSGVVTVGRGERCTVQAPDPLVTREHARIQVGSERGIPVLTIEDLNSACGTWVEDLQIEPGKATPILPGEVIVLGHPPPPLTNSGEQAAMSPSEANQLGYTVLIVLPDRRPRVI
jgi:FHA domain